MYRNLIHWPNSTHNTYTHIHTYAHMYTPRHIYTHVLTSHPFFSHLATLESRPKMSQKKKYFGAVFIYVKSAWRAASNAKRERGKREGCAVGFEVRGRKVNSGWAWARCNASTQLERHFKRLKNCTHVSTIQIMQAERGRQRRGQGRG